MANIERLKKLAEAVELAPADRFSMSAWCRQASCGTAACAVGWYAISTAPEHGWRLDLHAGYVRTADGDRMRLEEWAAHFGIGYEDAAELFVSGRYGWRGERPDKSTVLLRIRGFISSKEPQEVPA